MQLIHLSDLHLSRYGESDIWTARQDEQEGAWEVLHPWMRWQVEGRRDRRGRPGKLRLVDPEGVIHLVQAWPPRKEEKAIGELLALAMKRHATSTESLIEHRPPPHELRAMLRLDRRNTNLRFLQLIDEILPLDPALILLTGDTTNNGFGYGLVEHYLAPWIEDQRVFVIPGNHDTYEMFPGRSRRTRRAAKEKSYLDFATRVGTPPEATGAYLRFADHVAIVGLNSCKPPAFPLLSASGEVSREQLLWMSELSSNAEFRSARLRIALVHHHVLRMPFGIDHRHPIEMAMRLRNAAAVLHACAQAGINIVFNGHRHHGYTVLRPGHPMVVSSPSSTLGCKSTEMHYVWKMDIAARRPFPEVHRLTGHRRATMEAPIITT